MSQSETRPAPRTLVDETEDLIWDILDRTYRPWRYPDPSPMPRLVLFTIPDRVRAWAARLPHRTRSAPPSAQAAHGGAGGRSSPGAAGTPPRSAPGRRTPRYHRLRD